MQEKKGKEAKKKNQLNLAMFIEFIFHIVATADSLLSQEDSLKSAWRRSSWDNRISYACTGSETMRVARKILEL